jgi:NAD(P)-dependent dehydrogenase (short-subunit alcohol dehydrogenase family)
MSLQGKVIAVTGGASGIGLATAKLLASRGAKVSIADVQEKLLDEAFTAIKATGHNDVLTAVVDVRKQETIDAWIKKTIDTFGKLDGAANLAGVFRSEEGWSVEREDEKNWEFMIGVNLTGVMHCLKAELPNLTQGGSVVNAASILGIQGAKGAGAYSVSKHGVVGLTRSAAKDVGSKGIRVNAIAP